MRYSGVARRAAQNAVRLAVGIKTASHTKFLTLPLPRVECDLRRQMNRAAISIPLNIAEGWKRKGRRAAYQNHISIAMGSHAELETQLEICFRNRFLDPSTTVGTINLLNRAGQLLERLHDSLY